MLNKQEFVRLMSKRGYTKGDANVIVEDFIATLETAVLEYDGVKFKGFGSFEIRRRKSHAARVLQKNVLKDIPEYLIVHFSNSTPLKDKLRKKINSESDLDIENEE